VCSCRAMDPTKLPTDNLYKFMAILGLLLMGFAVYVQWHINNMPLEVQVAKSRGDAAVNQAKLERLQRAQPQGEPPTEEFVAAKMAGKLQMYQEDAIRSEIDRNRQINGHMNALEWWGIAMSVLGFGLWYWKLQRHLDKAVVGGSPVKVP